MIVLLGYFLIAAIAATAASAIIALVLTNLMVHRFTKSDRPLKVSCASELNEENEKNLWRSDNLRFFAPASRRESERDSV